MPIHLACQMKHPFNIRISPGSGWDSEEIREQALSSYFVTKVSIQSLATPLTINASNQAGCTPLLVLLKNLSVLYDEITGDLYCEASFLFESLCNSWC